MRLADRVVFFTEAGEGAAFGRSWASAATREGARLVVGDRRRELAAELVAQLRGQGAQAQTQRVQKSIEHGFRFRRGCHAHGFAWACCGD